MIYIADQLHEGFMPATGTVKIKPISTSMIAQLVHDEREHVVSLLCDEDLRGSIREILVVEDFPMIGEDAFEDAFPGNDRERCRFSPGDVLIVLLTCSYNRVATWAEYTFSE